MRTDLLKEILIKDKQEDCWLKFIDPIQVLTAWKIEDVQPQLQLIENAVNQNNYYAAGFIDYEASSAFDLALVTKATKASKEKKKSRNAIKKTKPLLCFGLYKNVEKIIELPPAIDSYQLGEWKVATSKSDYVSDIENIKARIESGETYQVNYTIRQHASFTGSVTSFFSRHAVNASYGALVDLDEFAICSASPELFFTLRDGVITSKPMKGTAARGLGSLDDQSQKRMLSNSEKDRAENIMIVDMIRNDLSKIAKFGSIKVSDQFKVEQHGTVWQMTSSVCADTCHSVTEIMSALFPCASITGAPKVKAMEIIDELESEERNIYTGTIGYIGPGGNAQFNVAIRTALIDKIEEKITYGIGGGIVADSKANSEYEECMLKARIVSQALIPNFSLLETLLWKKDAAYFLLDEHLKRMSDSAEYFSYPFSKNNILEKLISLEKNFSENAYKLRILLTKNGEVTIDYDVLENASQNKPINVCLAPQPIDNQNHFLYHKSTKRDMYQQALDACPEYSDVLMWNENQELTETCIANIVIKRGDKYVTPAKRCGLLAGTYRQYLLDRGEIQEGILRIDELVSSTEIYRINSVRQWQKLSFIIDDQAKGDK
ncbi:MAG: para-aminobenzoate synthetase/4-amino-4-deoxychorismate lyase [Flavobacterium sp.]|jgi:para-aminobenzoate synthetase/4-amino-4-deoxychorismate lyase